MSRSLGRKFPAGIALVTLLVALVPHLALAAPSAKITLSQLPQIVQANLRISMTAQVSGSSSRNPGWQGKLQVSKDDGETWSTQRLTKGTVVKATTSGRFEFSFKIGAGEYVIRLAAENKLRNQKAYSNTIAFTADPNLKYFLGINIEGDPEDLTSEDFFTAFLSEDFLEQFDMAVVKLEAQIDGDYETVYEAEVNGATEVGLPLSDLDGEYELYISIYADDEELITRYELGSFTIVGV